MRLGSESQVVLAKYYGEKYKGKLLVIGIVVFAFQLARFSLGIYLEN